MRIIEINDKLSLNNYNYEIITSYGIYIVEMVYDGSVDLDISQNGEPVSPMSFLSMVEVCITSNKHTQNIINFLIDTIKMRFVYSHRVDEINKIL